MDTVTAAYNGESPNFGSKFYSWWLGTAGSEGTGKDVWKQQTEMSLFKC